MAERTTQGRYRQREGDKQEQQTLGNACHGDEGSAYTPEQSSWRVARASISGGLFCYT
jgi:hypothetical protein